MKKLFLSFSLALCAAAGYAQGTIVTIQDSISVNRHFVADSQYLLKGWVYVTNGTTLTIDAGVVIKGDKNTKGTLIVEQGAKLYANGTVNKPVIFTSNQPKGNRSYGDWGGVVLCGKAPNNWNAGTAQVEGGPRSLYGGTDPNDNSGSLSYVRIEFPGIAFSPNNEVNGLSLYSVGDGTQIDHVMVSYSGDDGIEWFGGTVNSKHVISYRTWDDDFDTDVAYSGKNQFMVAIRDPYAADVSGSKAFESDAYQNGTYSGVTFDNTKVTRPVFSNCTIIGPMVSNGSTAWDNQYVSAAHVRRGSAMSIVNSVFLGWPCGLLVDESAATFGSTIANIANGQLEFKNNIIGGTAINSTPNPKDIVYVFNGARSLTPTTAHGDTTNWTSLAGFNGPWSWIKAATNGNRTYSTNGNVGLQNAFTNPPTAPNLVPLSNSPIAFNATHPFNPMNPLNPDTTNNFANYNMPTVPPDFTNTKASDAFFTKVNYVGAFSGTQTTADNWFNEPWINFDPNNTDYPAPDPLGVNTLANNIEHAAIFPNPAQHVAYLRFNMMEPGNVAIRLLDLTGKTVKTLSVEENASGVRNYNLDLGNVQPGFYFVSISSNGTQRAIKLSVIK